MKQELLKKVANWFYKDSHLVIKQNHHDLPDGGLHKYNATINMLTIQPYSEQSVILRKDSDVAEATGTYGLSPFDIFNPFKTNSNLAWLMMYQQGLLKDVSAEIDMPSCDPVLVTVNNPQVGCPYVVFYDNPILAVIPSPFVGSRFNLSEGESCTWTSPTGLKLEAVRNNDTDNKEFVITILGIGSSRINDQITDSVTVTNKQK
jgi:hypothetical protein